MAGLNVAALIYSDPTGTQQPCLCMDLCGCWAGREIKHETACLWLTCQRLSLSLPALMPSERVCWMNRVRCEGVAASLSVSQKHKFPTNFMCSLTGMH